MFLLVALFIIGIMQAFLIDKNKGVFLVLLTVLTFVISYILSFKMPMLPRYLIFLSIVFFIGIAVSYRVFYSLWSNKAVVYGFIVVLFVISVSVLVQMGYYSGYSKDDWRGFSEALQEKTSPGDVGRFGSRRTLPSLLIITIHRQRATRGNTGPPPARILKRSIPRRATVRCILS